MRLSGDLRVFTIYRAVRAATYAERMPAPVVAVFNTSEDTTEMLRHALEHAGFLVVTAMTNRLRDSEVDFEAFMRQHRPAVIVYDIALPYKPNWQLFEHFRESPACRGVQFVITSTNAERAREAAAESRISSARENIHEIVGKPYDLLALVELVRDAAAKSSHFAD